MHEPWSGKWPSRRRWPELAPVLPVALSAFGGAAIAFGVYLLAAGIRRASNWMVAGLTLGFGGFVILGQLPALGVPGVWPIRFATLEIVVFYSFLIAFVVVYPDTARTRRKQALLALSALPALVAVGAMALDPEALVTDSGTMTAFGATLWTVTGALFHLLSIVVLGHRYLVAAPGPRRTKIVYVLGPFMLEALNDGLFYASPRLLHESVGAQIPVLARVLGTLAVLSVALVALSAWFRPYGSRVRSREDRWLLPWAFAGLALSVLQLGAGGMLTHLIVDSGFIVLLLYGVAKYQTFDIDLKIKWTIKHGTLVALFVAFFFVVSELAAAFLADRVGPVLGILAAGILLFALAPLQRLAEKVADTAMPHVADTPAHRARRQEEIYRGALEEALAGGGVTVKERRLLLRLQEDMGLAADTAVRLERELLEGEAAQ